MFSVLPILLALGCGTSPDAPELAFVRGGVVVDGAFVAAPWTPGEVVTVQGRTGTAPEVAECVARFSVPLGDVSRLVVGGGAAPDTALAFSPSGDRLAVGAITGALVVVDVHSGREVARTRRSETMIKQVAWASDGSTLYVGEQSPDAFVQALDPDTLEVRWAVRLADEVETSAPPPGDDLYGVYTLPAAYSLEVLPGGDVLVAAAHGWNQGGQRKNRSRLLRISDGEIVAAWPERVADAIFWHPVVHGDTVALPVGRSAAGPAPADLPVGGVQLLRLSDLSPVDAHRYEPLRPWFQSVFVWEAIALSDTDLVVALGDGRVVSRSLADDEGWTWRGGAPVMAGEVPIFASIGHLQRVGEDVLVATSGTNIPFGSARPDLRPPRAHPNANTLWERRDNEVRWQWSGPYAIHGFTVDGPWLVVGAGPRTTDDRRDLYGAVVFDRRREGPDRLETVCSTEGPVFFRQAARGGHIAVAEFPYQGPSGLIGAYRAVVFR